MNKLTMIAGCAAVALAGCATRQAAIVEECNDGPCLPGITNLEAKHARLKSILGINDAALSDTNRFVLGEGDFSQKLKLDKPFCGFAEARVYLDKMEDPRLQGVRFVPPRLSGRGRPPGKLRTLRGGQSGGLFRTQRIGCQGVHPQIQVPSKG